MWMLESAVWCWNAALPRSSGDWRAVWNPENLGTQGIWRKAERDFSIVHNKRHLMNESKNQKRKGGGEKHLSK